MNTLCAKLRRLREVFFYNQRTGNFTWKSSRAANAVKGSVAGTLTDGPKGGYIQLTFDGRHYRAHVLAIFYVTGKWPRRVDHRDGNKANNKWRNLRTVTSSQNNCNMHNVRSDNVSGKTGVSWSKVRKRWVVAIKTPDRLIPLGTFHYDELDKAITARREGELKYHGEYAPEVLVVRESRVQLPTYTPRSSNVSGKTGVSWVARDCTWMARLSVKGKIIELGVFPEDHLDDAIAARKAGELKHLGKYSPT